MTTNTTNSQAASINNELTTDEMPSWLQALPEGDEAGMFPGAAIVYTEDQLIEFGLKCGYAAAGTVSQAASIDADPYFCKLLSRIAEFGFTGEHDKALVAYIDAKLAQARQEGFLAGGQHQHEVEKERAEKAEQYAQVALGIKDSLESRLAEIQRGVEGLTHYKMWDGNLCETSAGNHPEHVYVNLEKVLALLQPQGQADTSGLPG